MLVLLNYKQETDAMDIEAVIRKTREQFLTVGIPVFSDVKNALKAIASVSRYVSSRNRSLSSRKD